MASEMPVMGNKYVSAIPMGMLTSYAAQAVRNHGQTLDRLASRGGMCTSEILAVMDGLKWGAVKNCDANDLLLFSRVTDHVRQLASS
ncbi:MAG: hypothetical protein K2X80_07335 [Pseudomonadaceae bacterium]|nr:hypothetical protein [Pseudomonadaceae bacterium]